MTKASEIWVICEEIEIRKKLVLSAAFSLHLSRLFVDPYLMSNLVKEWEEARDDLGIEIVAPFDLDLGGGVVVHADLLVKNFGARKGMLVVREFSAVEPYEERLIEGGYGYSVLEGGGDYGREDFINLLSDWSWSGPADQKPGWVVEMSENDE